MAGPAHWLTLVYGIGTAAGCWWLRRHPAVLAAGQRREEAAALAQAGRDWRARLAPLLDLRGSHRRIVRNALGQTWIIDTHGTGSVASRVLVDYVAERLAGILKIRKSRVEAFADPTWADRLIIVIRDGDPWAKPVLHPMVESGSPYAHLTPFPATIGKPLAIGTVPETGAPLLLAFFAEGGAKQIGILGEPEAGKTNLLNCCTAVITACPDAALLQINLAKPQADEAWAPAAAATALRNPELATAVLAFACAVILLRSSGETSHPHSDVHEPVAGAPAYIVKIDEIDRVSDIPGGPRLLWFVVSKGRSEAVGAVLAGQRATAAYFGGADIRASIRTAVAGKVTSDGELRHLIGDEAVIPDMRSYGEGAAGVFLITERSGGAWSRGRTFLMTKDPRTWRQVADKHKATRGPFTLDAYLAPLAPAWEAIQASDGATALAELLAVVPDLADLLPEEYLDNSAAPAPTGAQGAGGDAPAGAGTLEARRAIAETLASLSDAGPGARPRPAAAPPTAAATTDSKMADLPTRELQDRLRELLVAGNVTSRPAAEVLGVSHTAVLQQLRKWQSEGTVKWDGTAWRAVTPPTRVVPYLRPVPDVVPDDAPGGAPVPTQAPAAEGDAR